MPGDRATPRPEAGGIRTPLPPSHVEVGDLQGIVLDELPARLHHVAHQRREDLVGGDRVFDPHLRSEEHTSELQSLMRISYAVFCLKKKTTPIRISTNTI